jgi:hypothetical protein
VKDTYNTINEGNNKKNPGSFFGRKKFIDGIHEQGKYINDFT